MDSNGRVLICGSAVPFEYGGAELHLEGLKRAVEEAGYQVGTVTIPYSWHPPERIVSSCLVWRMLDFCNQAYGEIDLVLATKFPTYAVKHPNKVAWVFHQHRSLYELKDTIYDDLAGIDGADEYREAIREMDRRFLGECRKVFATSENVARRLKSSCDVDSEPVYHPPPFDGRYYSEEYGDDVLIVGRLSPLKRVDLAIKAMKYIKSKSAVLQVIGTGFLEGPLRKMAEDEGVADRVRFRGFVTVDELLACYARAGCVIYVPFDEDYGYATLEAFKSRRPVVVTDDSGGPLEFVKDGENGRVVKAVPEELAHAVDELLANRKKARRFGKEGFEAVEGISWDTVLDAVVRPYI